MPLIYWHPQDEDAPPKLSAGFTTGDDPDWWVNLQKCGTVVCLVLLSSVSASNALAQTVAVQHQDDPSGNLTATVDEYFWQNPAPPIYIPPAQIFLQQEDDPAGSLTATVDEYFWQDPYKPLYLPPSQIFPDGNEQTPKLYGQFDEDFWDNPNPPLYLPPWQVIVSDELIVPQAAVAFQPDEDFWINPIEPITFVNFGPWPWMSEPMDIVPQPVQKQNYVAMWGTHNFVTQDTGAGIEY